MSDTPLTDAELSLWDEARILVWMLRDTRHWEEAYSQSEWLSLQEFYLVRLQLTYEHIQGIRTDSEAARGLEVVHKALACLDEQRHEAFAMRIMRDDMRREARRGSRDVD